jgi:DNA-binding transcriptional regulator YhcF (GntR family)
MSNKYLNWAWSLDIKPFPKLVLAALADYANKKGECWPSFESLCNKTSLHKTSISRHLTYLERQKFISRHLRHDQGGHRISNMYILNINQSSAELLRNYDEKIENVNTSKVAQSNSGKPESIVAQSYFGLSSAPLSPEYTSATQDSLYNIIEPSKNPHCDIHSQKDVHSYHDIVYVHEQKDVHKHILVRNEKKHSAPFCDSIEEFLSADEKIDPNLIRGFDEFWKAYPRKVGKKKALDIWKAKKLAPYLKNMLDDLQQRPHWTKDNPFVPHPTAYLNGYRWEDEEKGERTVKRTWETLDERNARAAAEGLARFEQRQKEKAENGEQEDEDYS